MSNYFGKKPVSECGRYNRSPKKKIKLPCLAVVQVYIKFMGGLDEADILISLHKTKCKTKKKKKMVSLNIFPPSYFIYCQCMDNI